ncbi:hypothetical protein FA13DRAFT_1770456 [Coprinellus micaceus]|uniref:Uncharacterized protein n=1 Tax=Coprinellus micaceus TaxID=71717 RepID=A0A4Y7TV24_COPMI|nr:hypothetical protein FA13DRAFT_1770456 [Coprinellus micaceus]
MTGDPMWPHPVDATSGLSDAKFMCPCLPRPTLRTSFSAFLHTTTTFMNLILSFLYALQLALYGLCQSSGPPITPPGFTVTTSGDSEGVTSTSSTTVTGTRPTTTRSTTSGSGSTSVSTTTTADFPSLSSYPACVSNCLAIGVAKSNCTSVVDVGLFLHKTYVRNYLHLVFRPDFVQELFRCVTTDCPDELTSSEDLAQRFCNIAVRQSNTHIPRVYPNIEHYLNRSHFDNAVPSTNGHYGKLC